MSSFYNLNIVYDWAGFTIYQIWGSVGVKLTPREVLDGFHRWVERLISLSYSCFTHLFSFFLPLGNHSTVPKSTFFLDRPHHTFIPFHRIYHSLLILDLIYIGLFYSPKYVIHCSTPHLSLIGFIIVLIHSPELITLIGPVKVFFLSHSKESSISYSTYIRPS